MNRETRPSTLIEREFESGRRIALGRRSDEDVRVFDPDTGEICESPVQAATIVDPSWVAGRVIAGHQCGPTDHTVVIYLDEQIIDRCAVTNGVWMSAPVTLEIGQALRFEWSNEDGAIVDSLTTLPLDRDALEAPRWHAYGPPLDR